MENTFPVMQEFLFREKCPVVRTMTDENGDPWFVAKDVCDILGLGNTSMAVKNLEEDELKTFEVIDGIGRAQNAIIINESGLYNLIFRSSKPQAKAFRKWVTGTVLPAIRKNGHFGFVPARAMLNDSQQLWALWARLQKQERTLSAQVRAVRKAKNACLSRLAETAPSFIMPRGGIDFKSEQ